MNELQVPLVKICGVRTLEVAQVAVDSGADLIGMIFVPGRTRTVTPEEAQKIAMYVRKRRGQIAKNLKKIDADAGHNQRKVLESFQQSKPLSVGIFQNQPLEEVLRLQREIGLDVIQFHGEEPIEWCRQVPVPVIKRFTPGRPGFENAFISGYHHITLIDSEVGGDGKLVDWTALSSLPDSARYLLAGGLTASNVVSALQQTGAVGVDVSGGVETNGQKDHAKIREFVRNAKSHRFSLK